MATLYFTGNGTQWDTLANWWQNSARTIPATSLPLPTDDIDANLTGGVAYNATPIVANSAIFRGTSGCFARPLTVTTTATFIGTHETSPASSTFPIFALTTGVNQPLIITADTLILKYIGMGWGQSGGASTINYKCGGTSTTVAAMTLNVNNLQILENSIVMPVGPSLTIKDNCNITIGKKYNIVSSTNTSPISITLDSPHYFTNNLLARSIIIENHTNNTNANGIKSFTVTGDNTLTLDGSGGNGTGGNTGQVMYVDSTRKGLCSVNIDGVEKPIIGNNFNIVCNATLGFGNGGVNAGVLRNLFASNNHNIVFNDYSGMQRNIVTCTNNIVFNGKKSKGPISSNNPANISPRMGNSTINANIELNDAATLYSPSAGTIINGNVICPQSVYPNNPINYGATVHNGSVTFSSAIPVIFRLTGNDTWVHSLELYSATFVAGDPSIELNDASSLLPLGSTTVSTNYDVTFNDSTNIPGPYDQVLVTVGGDVTFNESSYLLGTLVASNQSIISFNDNSFNAGSISGGSSINYNGFTGTNSYGTFINGARRTSINIPITVTNDAIFNGVSLNQNTLTGNATFNNFSGNSGTITGNATFTASSFSGSPTLFVGTVNGSITFSSNTAVTFTLNNSESWDMNMSSWIFSTPNPVWIFNDSSYNYISITGNCTFNDNSYNIGGAYIAGNCVFNDAAYNDGTIDGNVTFTNSSYSINPVSSGGGTINGTITFNSVTPVSFVLSGSSAWYGDTGSWIFSTAGQNWTFNDSSHTDTASTITGNCTFNDTSYNVSTITGNPTFNDASYNFYGTITGDPTFNDTSYNVSTITGNPTFNDTSYNNFYGTITGDPTFNDTSYNVSTITGNPTFNDTSYNNYGGIITGDPTFNDTSYNVSTINGNCTFNDNSYNGGTTAGLYCIFNNTSYNVGYIYGNCIFNDTSLNYYPAGSYVGYIYGNATFALSSAAAHIDGLLNSNGLVSLGDSITGTIDFKYEKGINGSSILGLV